MGFSLHHLAETDGETDGLSHRAVSRSCWRWHVCFGWVRKRSNSGDWIQSWWSQVVFARALPVFFFAAIFLWTKTQVHSDPTGYRFHFGKYFNPHSKLNLLSWIPDMPDIFCHLWVSKDIWFHPYSINLIMCHYRVNPLVYSKPNIRRKCRSQTSDNMDRWKAEQGRGREKRKIRREKSRRERVRRKKMQMCEKVGKSRNNVFFQWFGAPEGRKVGSLKQRVRSQLARWEMKNCTPLWREARFQVKRYKTPGSQSTFGSWHVEKVHAVVARSTFRSQNVQNTPRSDHFWKLRYRKSARGCGAKHISKSKCTKHEGFGPLLEVEMSKKCTQLWREAHFEVKMHKTHNVRTTFGSWDVEKVHAVVARSTFPSQNVQNTGVRTTFGGSDVEKVHAVVARSTFRSQNVKNTRGADHFWRFRCRFTSLHYTLHHTPLLHYSPLQYITQHYNYNYTTTLHYTPLH